MILCTKIYVNVWPDVPELFDNTSILGFSWARVCCWLSVEQVIMAWLFAELRNCVMVISIDDNTRTAGLQTAMLRLRRPKTMSENSVKNVPFEFYKLLI